MSEKSARRCATPRCVADIAKWGEHYHDVYPAYAGRVEGATDLCQRCGGMFDGATWRHVCAKCGTEVEPGALVGLFVPHMCQPCMGALVTEQEATGDICRACGKANALCYC